MDMVETIVRSLKRNRGVHDWQIQRVSTTQHELYLINKDIESSRVSLKDTCTVTIYHDEGGKRGSCTLTFTPAEFGVSRADGQKTPKSAEGKTDSKSERETESEIEERIERGVFAACLALNPMYGLMGPSDKPNVQVADPHLAEEPEKVLEKWRRDLVSTAEKEAQIKLSSAEFFIYNNRIEFLNSQGASYSYPSSRVFIEFVLLSNDGFKEAENYHSLTARRVADVDLVTVIRERSALARDMLNVTLPETWDGPVVITGDPLESLFYPFITRTRADMLYRGVYKTKVGDSIFGDRPVTGDPLHLSVDPTLPYGAASSPVDSEGVPARKIQVLTEGRVQNILASKRFADYLGIEVTGTQGNIVVAPGSLSEDELLKGPCYHLVSFASLDSNPMTGEFASEIRLGYKIDADGTRHPVKGGSVSGNVFDAFQSCQMSQDTLKAGSYFGPRSIRFEKLVIAGK